MVRNRPDTADMRIDVLLMLLLMASPEEATAQEVDDVRKATRPCRVERLDRAYALCVDSLFDQRDLAMDAAIGHTLSGLQAATASELQALQSEYEQSQKNWRRAVSTGCMQAFPENPRAQADCRLAAALSREDQLTLSLARASDNLGGPAPSGIDVPDAVEVFIPLPSVPNGPAQRIRVPLVVPILPQ